MAATIDSFFI